MKSLNMNEPHYYEMLYESMITRKRGYTLQESRTLGKILDKFEKCGKVRESQNGIDLYEMTGPCTIELEDAEFDLLYNTFTDTPWLGSSARKAVAVADWLDEVKKGG